MSKGIPEGHLAFDSSVLTEMLNGTELGSELTDTLLNGGIIAHTSFINVAEAEYVLCRKIGHPNARKKVEDLLASAYVSVEEDPTLHAIASEMKCVRAISLADCYTFAVAKVTSSKPVFVLKEDELLKEMNRRPFETQPIFLT